MRYGYWETDERTSYSIWTDAAGTCRPFGAYQGIYLPAGAQLNIPLYHHPYGHPAVPWNQHRGVFNEAPDEQIVFGKQDYFVKEDTEYKNEIKWIIPNAQKNMMEPILLTLEAGGETYPDNPHEGEEFGYVLQGSIAIHLGNKLYRARKGESFYFTPDKKHYLTSKTGAIILWVSSPPSF